MRAWEIRSGFGYDHLVLAERADPTCGPGDVRVAIAAVALNYRDLLMVQGLYNPRQPLPLIPCSDGVGRVVEVGEGVTRMAVGDRVAPTFARDFIGGEPSFDAARTTLGGPLDGTLAEQVVLPERAWVTVPEHLTDAEAATLPCAGVTAWNTVTNVGQVRPGHVVLLEGTGGVSIFALQFAKAAGAEVIITSSSDEKLERAKALGADHTINYNTIPEWGRAARALTGKRGVDLVAEVGGAGTFNEAVRSLRVGGRIALIGNLAGNAGRINLTALLMRNIRVEGILVGSRQDFEAMNRAIAAQKLRPVVDQVFPMEAAIDAMKAMGSASHLGKVVVDFGI